MILATSHGNFPIPPDVARLLPSVPDAGVDAFDGKQSHLEAWLQAAPENVIAFERLRRWHLVQEELASQALRRGQPYEVSADGLD